MVDDNRPRYTTKRLHDEITKAKEYARREALEDAAKAVEERFSAYEAKYGAMPNGPLKAAYLAASNALFVAAQNIRALKPAILPPAPKAAPTLKSGQEGKR